MESLFRITYTLWCLKAKSDDMIEITTTIYKQYNE